MEIILLTDIANLGHKDDIVDVKQGYGRNYLIPQGYAILATPSARKVVAENLRQRAHKEAKLKAEAEEIAAQLAEVKLTIGAKTDIDRKKIVLKDVKEIGTYTALIKLHREVKVDVEFEVVSE